MLPNRMAAIRKKKCFFPARPAMGKSEPIGATRWHRRSENRGTGARSPRTWRKQQGRPPCERQNFPLTFYRQIW